MKQNAIGVFILFTFALLVFSPLEGKAGENPRHQIQQLFSSLFLLAQYPSGGGGPVADYNYNKAKTPEEQRLEYLQLARKNEERAEKQLKKGQEKADKYRGKAAEIMTQAHAAAETNPDFAERILEKASQKAERLEKKAEEALKKSVLKAEKYTAKAEEYQKKAEDTLATYP